MQSGACREVSRSRAMAGLTGRRAVSFAGGIGGGGGGVQGKNVHVTPMTGTGITQSKGLQQEASLQLRKSAIAVTETTLE